MTQDFNSFHSQQSKRADGKSVFVSGQHRDRRKPLLFLTLAATLLSFALGVGQI